MTTSFIPLIRTAPTIESSTMPSGKPKNLIISPDSKKLLYLQQLVVKECTVNNAYTMNTDGTDQQQILAKYPNTDGFVGISFNWSPDSMKIAYTANNGDYTDVYC